MTVRGTVEIVCSQFANLLSPRGQERKKMPT